MAINEGEHMHMGLWHQATSLHHLSGMIGNLSKPLPLLPSAIFSGPLQGHLQQWHYWERWISYWHQKESQWQFLLSSSPRPLPLLLRSTICLWLCSHWCSGIHYIWTRMAGQERWSLSLHCLHDLHWDQTPQGNLCGEQ